jgi:hypothetical protein
METHLADLYLANHLIDPNQIHTLPDLVIDDDSPYSMDLHSNPPHHSHQQHQQHTHSNQPPNPNPSRHPYHSHAPDSVPVSVSHPVPGLPPVSASHGVPIHSIAAPGPGHPHPHHPHSHHGHPHHGHDVDAPGEIVPHSDDWNRLDTFQTRLEGLQYTLDRTMSKWAREADPNQEIPHHEGLGM